MKARFSQPQQRVKTITSGDKTYIFICLNETQGTESYPDMGDGQTQESYYEYDYNEIIGLADALPLEDIQSHPEDYLDYAYTPEKEDPGAQALADALESVIRYARNKMMSELAESEDKTAGIAYRGLIPIYEQDRQYEVGDVRTHPETGYPRECMTAYDGTVHLDWTIDTPTLWKPWHSRKKEYALPYEAPTGAHDMYRTGEYMIWTDKNRQKEVKHCLQDTNFSPNEYPQAWEDAE